MTVIQITNTIVALIMVLFIGIGLGVQTTTKEVKDIQDRYESVLFQRTYVAAELGYYCSQAKLSEMDMLLLVATTLRKKDKK